MSASPGVARFGAALNAVLDELDWGRLGRAYCEGDGAEFFDDERRQHVVDTGLLTADGLASHISAAAPRRSLYLGAALAELAPILAEHLVLGREVVWLNLACEESAELARALGAVAERLGFPLPKPSTESLDSVAPAGCGHLWMVSVLTDPDAFPALHDELYERHGSELATGRGDLAEETRRAEALCRALLARAADACLLSTTDEEWLALAPALPAAGLRARPIGPGPISALVGDRIVWSRLTRRRAR